MLVPAVSRVLAAALLVSTIGACSRTSTPTGDREPLPLADGGRSGGDGSYPGSVNPVGQELARLRTQAAATGAAYPAPVTSGEDPYPSPRQADQTGGPGPATAGAGTNESAPQSASRLLIPIAVGPGFQIGPAAAVSGERRKWHRITLSFEGPESGEAADPNPFRDYRMEVLLTHIPTGREVLVPGYFAADGRAAETGAKRGSVWRAHFAADAAGEWSYVARFRSGADVAISDEPLAGQSAGFDGASGLFEVFPTDKSGRDFRGKGLLQYVGGHHLRFAETGEYYLKGGANSPENFLAYFEFDDTVDQGGYGNDLADGLHRYEPHVRDWVDGDPTWHVDKGKGIIGALNYLASVGMNSVYFLTMNIAGDGREVYPWTGPAVRDRFDVSKLDQWEIVFDHMDRIGIAMHVVLQEAENDRMLDGGDLGPTRRLYYRELIARFAHHPAVTWNLGEENTNSTDQRKAHALYIRELDAYDHPITVHTAPGAGGLLFTPLLGFAAFEGPSLQSNKISDVNSKTEHWFNASEEAGRPWVTTADELGLPQVGAQPDASDPDRPRLRSEGLWGNLMAGGGGVEWFFGIGHPHNDLDMEDWRSRDTLWVHTRQALDFFQTYLPFHEMRPCNGLVDGDKAYCLGQDSEVYAVYLLRGGTVEMDLDGIPHPLSVQWYDPRSGGGLQQGTVTTISGPGNVGIGRPPAEQDRDWVALVRRVGR